MTKEIENFISIAKFHSKCKWNLKKPDSRKKMRDTSVYVQRLKIKKCFTGCFGLGLYLGLWFAVFYPEDELNATAIEGNVTEQARNQKSSTPQEFKAVFSLFPIVSIQYILQKILRKTKDSTLFSRLGAYF